MHAANLAGTIGMDATLHMDALHSLEVNTALRMHCSHSKLKHSDHLEYSTLEIGLTRIDATLGVSHWSALSELESTLGIECCTQKDSCTLECAPHLKPHSKGLSHSGFTLCTLAHLGALHTRN
jgi:hypothetical protein